MPTYCKGKDGEGCDGGKQANYGLNGKKTHCGKCKSAEMYNPNENKCIVCKEVTASFGLNGKMTHCKKCKSAEMYRPREDDKCIDCKKKGANYGLNGKRTHCFGCKDPAMYNPSMINAGKIEDDKKDVLNVVK